MSTPTDFEWFPNEPPLRLGLRLIGLLALIATIVPEANIARRGHIPSLVLLVAASLSWIAWLAARDRGQRERVALAVAIMAIAGGTLAPAAGAAIIFIGVAGIGAAMAFELPAAIGLVALGPVAHIIIAAVQHHSLLPVAGSAAAGMGGLVLGVARRQAGERAEQQALITVERERSELLAERNRLAREIHDVLAHTLGAVSVQIEALDAVVDAMDLDQVHARLQSTRSLVTQGLDEARRAVSALRDDAPPLAQQLKEVCAASGAELVVVGEVRALTSHVSLALLRIAQESLTNASKHAPGPDVIVTLTFSPGTANLSVRNGRGEGASPHAASGGGYGLQGMRERVLLLGGELEAGPSADGWLVTVSLPA